MRRWRLLCLVVFVCYPHTSGIFRICFCWRFISSQEMCIGILANMSCNNQIASKITEDEDLVNLIIASLFSDDIPTIIQCLRFLDVLVQIPDENFLKITRSSEPIWSNISIILSNSLNGKLFYIPQRWPELTSQSLEDLLCSSAKLLDLLISHLDLEGPQVLIPVPGNIVCLAA